MLSHEYNPSRLMQVEELLKEYDGQLHEFELELARAAGGDQRVKLRRQIKAELIPKRRQLEQEYAKLLVAGVELKPVPEEDAQELVNDINQVINAVSENNAPQEMVRLMREIRDKLNQPKSASAKLKITLPVIPLLASYDLELDTEGALTQVWRKARDFFKSLLNASPH